jgi:hypothetical protein
MVGLGIMFRDIIGFLVVYWFAGASIVMLVGQGYLHFVKTDLSNYIFKLIQLAFCHPYYTFKGLINTIKSWN